MTLTLTIDPAALYPLLKPLAIVALWWELWRELWRGGEEREEADDGNEI